VTDDRGQQGSIDGEYHVVEVLPDEVLFLNGKKFTELDDNLINA